VTHQLVDDPKTATLHQKLFGQDLVWEIGLDGHYHQLLKFD